jgi:hypothetical protein
MAPLGYDTKDRKIFINDTEADRVRTIFRSYLRLGSLNRLMTELRDQGIVTKIRTLKTGKPSVASRSRADRSPTCSATGSTLERWHSGRSLAGRATGHC